MVTSHAIALTGQKEQEVGCQGTAGHTSGDKRASKEREWESYVPTWLQAPAPVSCLQSGSVGRNTGAPPLSPQAQLHKNVCSWFPPTHQKESLCVLGHWRAEACLPLAGAPGSPQSDTDSNGCFLRKQDDFYQRHFPLTQGTHVNDPLWIYYSCINLTPS